MSYTSPLSFITTEERTRRVKQLVEGQEFFYAVEVTILSCGPLVPIGGYPINTGKMQAKKILYSLIGHRPCAIQVSKGNLAGCGKSLR